MGGKLKQNKLPRFAISPLIRVRENLQLMSGVYMDQLGDSHSLSGVINAHYANPLNKRLG